MQIEQRTRNRGGWSEAAPPSMGARAQLALAFASTEILAERAIWAELVARYPNARIVGCSTAGEIAGTRVLDDSLVTTAIAFDHSAVAVAQVELDEADGDAELGALLAQRLPHDGLIHMFVLSHGTKVDGSALVAGITGQLPRRVAVTGGLSGDGARFASGAVCLDGPVPADQVVAIGFYGDRLRIGYGSLGGWDAFGPERRITRSRGNVLIELDGEPALDLYKRYLGDAAAGLPASGLRFPLAIRGPAGRATPVVRTLRSIDEAARTVTFGGDLPSGYRARLMRASLERLVGGAAGAATASLDGAGPGHIDLAILISGVGRKLVLEQRIGEEIEAARGVLGDTVTAGFYAYGEIAPFTSAARCMLHNQTMTITTISER